VLHAVIMAGGSGTRFWPRSRAATPKQLIRITSDRTMIQEGLDRLVGLFPPERILIITNEAQAAETRRQLPGLPAEQIVGEPEGRDTAACIGFAAMLLRAHDPDAIMAVTPADHLIEPASRYHEALRAAAEVAAKRRMLVTFGIPPAEPSTLFGYIERGEPFDDPCPFPAFKVARFREKPDRDTARTYVDSGRFYWNSGIFVWRVADILNALQRFMPRLHGGLERIAAAIGTDSFAAVLAEQYPQLPKNSIDYGVMEHAANVGVLEVDYSWDDVGSWESLARVRGADGNGNTVEARHIGIDTESCIIAAEGDHLVGTIGISGLIIVHTGDATLVCDRSRAADVKALVQKLREQGHDACL